MKKITAIVMSALMSMAMLSGCGAQTGAESTTGTGAPTFDFSSIYDEGGFITGINAAEYVELSDYSTIELKKADVTASKDEINGEIDSILEQNKEEIQNKKRKIVDGDEINLDYSGSIDGEKFDGGTAENQTLVIGSHSFVDDFEEQLIGHKAGDEVKVEVTFPEDYDTKDLAGKDAVFECKINYIIESKTPELTDAFVKKNLEEDYGYESVKDMKEKIGLNIEENKKAEALRDYLVENCKIIKDKTDLIAKYIDVQIAATKQEFEAAGYDFSAYLSSVGAETEDDLKEKFKESAESAINIYLIADAIAIKEGITVDEKVLKEYFGENDYQQYIDYYTENYINRYVLTDAVMKLLMGKIVVK